MDVRGPPCVVVVAPGVGAGLDGDELVAAVPVGHGPAAAGEVRVDRRGPGVPAVAVAPGGVRLPDLHQRVADRAAVGVEQPPGDGDPLADRHLVVLAREVVLDRPRAQVAELRAGRLRHLVGQVDGELLSRQGRRLVVGEVDAGSRMQHLPQSRECRRGRSLHLPAPAPWPARNRRRARARGGLAALGSPAHLAARRYQRRPHGTSPGIDTDASPGHRRTTCASRSSTAAPFRTGLLRP